MGDAEFHTAEGVGFDEIDEFPADIALGELVLEFANERGGGDALKKAADGARKADIDLRDAEFEIAVGAGFGEIDVVDANDFAASGVNDLLIEEVLLDGEPGFVGLVSIEGALGDIEINASGDGAANLVVAGDEGLVAAAGDEEVGDAIGLLGGMDEKFADAANVVGVDIVGGGAHEFGGVEHEACPFGRSNQ